MTELTDQQVLERAQQAKRILDDDLFKETILGAEEAIVARWRMALVPEEREDCHFELRGLQRVVRNIRSILEDGEILKTQLEKKKRHEQ